MRSSQYVQETVLNDNDFNDYQNVPSVMLQKEKNQNQRPKRSSQPDKRYPNVNNSAEVLINNVYDIYNREDPISNVNKAERNANKYEQDIELMCKCPIKDVAYPSKTRFKQEQGSNGQNVIASSRSCCSTPKLGENRTYSQLSLDRRLIQSKYPTAGNKHSYYLCDPSSFTGVVRNASLKSIQSPEIINAHLGPHNFLYDGYGPENCAIKSYGYDKDLKNDDYGFRRGPSLGRATERSNIGRARHKKRIAGDGMDSEMDDPELSFAPADHLRTCRCPCDHVLYGPGYSCLQVS
ncbi:uncharacterized protein LOC116174557 [Photinus pyralis]|uniref:uncharacterized protein LOC116174557 n=1 Tax=Photinus pyralis TaxID=7054 RepID=UPI001267555F|nr:uncharacterized protein LOC116174557 [Photinus pyralis]